MLDRRRFLYASATVASGIAGAPREQFVIAGYRRARRAFQQSNIVAQLDAAVKRLGAVASRVGNTDSTLARAAAWRHRRDACRPPIALLLCRSHACML
jgi:hypothetical protein